LSINPCTNNIYISTAECTMHNNIRYHHNLLHIPVGLYCTQHIPYYLIAATYFKREAQTAQQSSQNSERRCDAGAYAQNDHENYDVQCIREESGPDDIQERAPGRTVGLREEELV